MPAPRQNVIESCTCCNCAGKRLESVGVENTEDNRRDWRQLL